MLSSLVIFWLTANALVRAAAMPAEASSEDSAGADATGSRKTYTFGTPNVNATFDYVIAGGGTAGLTLATRLAQKYTVAVIEAGGFYEKDVGNTSTIPGYVVFYAGTDPADTNPLIDWSFVTTPQAGAANRKLHYARGKTLGGSSARNFLLYHRPTIGSLQKWADEVGDQTYSWDQWLPFYKKSVQYTPPLNIYTNSTNKQDSSAFDPAGGPLQVSFGNYENPLGSWFQRAYQAVGQKAINGFQSGKLLGNAYVALTVDPKKQERSSSESSFLQNLAAPKLTVYKNTLAQKINFGPQNAAQSIKVAAYKTSGVSGQSYILKARREVIVCAGAFQSPQLLMVSGIGPKAMLEKYKIPVLKDLPGVGQNMWDQPFFGTTFRVNLLTTSATLVNPALNVEAGNAYRNNRAGPLTTPGIITLGWENFPASYSAKLQPATQQSLQSTFPADWPQLEYLPIGEYIGDAGNFITSDPGDGKNYATLVTALITPFSRGTITLQSANMADAPLINPNWLTDPRDTDQAIAAIRRQRDVWSNMRGITIGAEVLPGANVQSDADILAYIRKVVVPIWHATSTCKMGKQSDKMAVLDPATLAVYGTKNLRVVDASSFPFLPPGHPQSVVYALAEKVAAAILAAY